MPDIRRTLIGGQGLAALETRLKEDLQLLCYPGKSWVPPRQGVTDVTIIGGGMCGMVAWFALQTAGIVNTRVLDRSPRGFEGPWLNYARMETLRSPKELTGPAFGHGALTFQAWYRAGFGDQQWEQLGLIPRPVWMDYLRWYRDVLGIPIENETSLDKVEREGDVLRLHFSGETSGSFLSRKLVFATGRDGTGEPNIPGFVDGLDRRYWAHSADDIDFDSLKGKRVAVIGVGASAVDNAAEALEHGAAEVRHFIRRKQMPTINKLTGAGSIGFNHGFATLSDELRWRIMQYVFASQTPPPNGSVRRVSQHRNAFFHFDKGIAGLSETGGAVELKFSDGRRHVADFVILGTGFRTNPLSRTELGDASGNIRLWKDVYQPPADEHSEDLALFPYLNSDFSFSEKIPGKSPWINNIYCFNYGATASLGKISGDIPGISEGAAWLARATAAKIFSEDADQHLQAIKAYDKPELDGSEWVSTQMPDIQGKEHIA
ncbi:NAD(P)-binding domain-containing protein [Stappia sp. ES.058]|uniref:NAD(P)-binding domain-containing protein n=1 Tax=Stappia sp. ES.058 TaxID=1881061 RepID=UPI00087C9860|nr:NAD(P)/FAD-dependent oxidoreductase [Stappia sp. ES.058]SDU43008.1 hypothetical protein SAMN05428979_3746 [Stappia sp. ES.058]